MSTPVGILWTLLSIMVAGCCSFSFLQPSWLMTADTLDALGIFGYCVQDVQKYGTFDKVCGIYGGSFRFSNLPSSAWQAACVLYGGGCALMCLGALFAILTLCLPSLFDKHLTIFTGYVQALGVLLMVTGLVVFPAGFNSVFCRRRCPNTRMYYAGGCHVGWAYMLGIMGTALSMFCPFLSQYTNYKSQHSSTSAA